MSDKNPLQIRIAEYYSRYGPMVLRRCRQLLRNEEKARDAMQEVFVKLILYHDRLKDRYPSSLLYRISTNICLNLLRAEKKRATALKEDMFARIAGYDHHEEKFVLRDTLDRLFRREKISTREIAVMHFIDGMTLKEVAREVGLSVSGVRKRLRNLRARLESLEETPDEG